MTRIARVARLVRVVGVDGAVRVVRVVGGDISLQGQLKSARSLEGSK